MVVAEVVVEGRGAVDDERLTHVDGRVGVRVGGRESRLRRLRGLGGLPG